MNDTGNTLVSVVVSMVIFGMCFTAMLQGYTRATAATWNARVGQQAAAVAAWHTAEAQQNGCSASTVTGLKELGGHQLLPYDGFTVTCDDTRQIEWPPPLIVHSPCDPDDVCVEVLAVTVEWVNRGQVLRSLRYAVIGPS